MINTFIMLLQISISDKCSSSELSIHQRNLEKLYSADIYIYILHIFWAANQHIRMISEGSHDTEDWINDKNIQIEKLF